VVSCKIPILLANVLKLTGSRIDNLDIASHIFLSPNFAEVVEAGLCQNWSNLKNVLDEEGFQEMSTEM
jgi:hypothetical protein